jgi:hypothetical protein
MDDLKGTYRHYKGNLYEVIGQATHSETEEQLVVYLTENKRMFVRPAAMFFETVSVNGDQVPRFKKIN